MLPNADRFSLGHNFCAQSQTYARLAHTRAYAQKQSPGHLAIYAREPAQHIHCARRKMSIRPNMCVNAWRADRRSTRVAAHQQRQQIVASTATQLVGQSHTSIDNSHTAHLLQCKRCCYFVVVFEPVLYVFYLTSQMCVFCTSLHTSLDVCARHTQTQAGSHEMQIRIRMPHLSAIENAMSQMKGEKKQ